MIPYNADIASMYNVANKVPRITRTTKCRMKWATLIHIFWDAAKVIQSGGIIKCNGIKIISNPFDTHITLLDSTISDYFIPVDSSLPIIVLHIRFISKFGTNCDEHCNSGN